MTKLTEIEGIGDTYAAKLRGVGIESVEDLRRAGATPAGRRALEEKTGIGHQHILRWVNMADLFRITGVGEQYADLLEAAGVDTLPELAQRNPEHLESKMAECNAERVRVKKIPTRSQIEKWVAEAKSLPRVIHY